MTMASKIMSTPSTPHLIHVQTGVARSGGLGGEKHGDRNREVSEAD